MSKSTKITKFDREECKAVGEAAKAALEEVAARFGLTLKQEGGRFDAAQFTPKFTFACVAEGGIPADFARNCVIFGLTKDDYGKTFTRVTGDEAKIVSIHPRRSKFPIGCEINGKVLLLTEREVLKALGRADPYSFKMPSNAQQKAAASVGQALLDAGVDVANSQQAQQAMIDAMGID